MPSKTKFQKLFADPVEFDEGLLAIDFQYSQDEAARRMSEYLECSVNPFKLKFEKVRYQFVSEELYGERSAWLLGVEGHGAKEVWVYERG